MAQVTGDPPDAEISGPASKKCPITEPQDSDEGRMSPVTQMKGVAGRENEQRSGSSQQAIDDNFLADEPIEEDSEEEIEDDLEEPKSLSAETPVFVSRSKAKHANFILTQPTWPSTTTSKKLIQTVEPFPFPSSQPRTTKINKTQSARDHKRANETPVWADTQVVVSDEEPELMRTAESFPFPLSQPRTTRTKKTQSARDHKRANNTPVWEVVMSDEEPEAAMASYDHSDSEEDDPDAPIDHSGRPKLVWSDTEAKVHMTFVNGYLELMEKSFFTQDALLTAARACGVSPIQDCLKSDDSYVTALTMLVEAQVPLFHTELKDDACTQVSAYYRLGPDCVNTAKALLINHVYHYEQHCNEKNDPILQSKKPYFADILPYLMKGRYFNGLKSVGVKFSDRFKKIASNKAQRPEVTIPMVALTSTSVYAALFWKANGSPSKFNFTGNLFSEVYFFHVKFLEDMKVTAPHKFHKMMADIFEAIQKLCTSSNTALVGSHESAMAFLNINGMDGEE
ncbi:uncharacterized protein EDB93DRAFT_1250218 [Suillus bovinus]|uniref:uncharacterized protein n=1 Tax=Suillus bovinus TaxID=48563 RepID=UPI001B87F08D|nr:uncharacterized protein EDB93DRAFT_1250218 [Suillus bovinus]KAG2148159.1 hypothetical protein EDB93DRAFT_1250218 [Suillus bovinus]